MVWCSRHVLFRTFPLTNVQIIFFKICINETLPDDLVRILTNSPSVAFKLLDIVVVVIIIIIIIIIIIMATIVTIITITCCKKCSKLKKLPSNFWKALPLVKLINLQRKKILYDARKRRLHSKSAKVLRVIREREIIDIDQKKKCCNASLRYTGRNSKIL